jgi:hypothetical protein
LQALFIGILPVITCVGNKIVPENDDWNGYQIKVFTAIIGVFNYYPIFDCTHGVYGENDTITLTSYPGDLSNSRFIICEPYPSTTEVNYIRAGSSISLYGTIETLLKDESRLAGNNLVKTPAMDTDSNSDGLCDNWTKNLDPTCTMNTNILYIQHGSKSQKIVGDASHGIYQDVSITANLYYTLSVWLFIVSGTINVILEDDTGVHVVSAKADVGWQQFVIKEMLPGTIASIYIYPTGGAGEFYVDSACFYEGDADRSFFIDNENKLLWDDCFNILIKSLAPKVEYEAVFADLNKMFPADYPFDQISLGDTVYITDDNLGLQQVAARIKKITVDEFVPSKTKYTVSNIV